MPLLSELCNLLPTKPAHRRFTFFRHIPVVPAKRVAASRWWPERCGRWGSAVAAKDIKLLIEQVVAQVESGVESATGTSQSILKIMGMVGELAEFIDILALASSEQMQGISQVSVAVSQMDGVTQNNAALVEEASPVSRSLSEQAHPLRGMVEAFRV